MTIAHSRFQDAFACHQKGDMGAARALYDEVLALDPQHFDALHFSGVAAAQAGSFAGAAERIARALAINPNHAGAHYNMGIAQAGLEQYDAALDSFERSLALNPDNTGAHYHRGNILQAFGRFEEALADYEKALARDGSLALIHNERGRVLGALQRHAAALASYAEAIRLKPDFAAVHNNRALSLVALKRHNEAIADYRKAVALQPNLADTHNNLGNALAEMKQYEAAIASYDEALRLNPGYPFLAGTRLHTRMLIADWTDIEAETEVMAAKIAAGEKTAPPFQVLTLIGTPALQCKAADTWVRAKYAALAPRRAFAPRPKAGKIRIGYFSADFRVHPVALLMAGMIEHHDRARFDVTGFSLGSNTGDGLRQRLEKSFDALFDVHGKSDGEIADMARAKGIDIAVDLSGHTNDLRAGAFVQRLAPIQVNFLGYPGTMGAQAMDYVVADETIIPAAARIHYTEKVVWLPDTYQPNDASRTLAGKIPSRTALGLPETGFVFCCFNNNYKITPGVFDLWARILKDVEGSVLWLLRDNDSFARNLKQEAARRDVDPARIVFAGRAPLGEHLARHRAADLFLDTLPYNAHTTGSDALWAGLPVLTRLGEGFAGRVAASLLKAMGVPELITSTPEEYRETAVALARDPARLANLKQKIAQNRAAAPLFDIARFTRHMEDAYTLMKGRYDAGEGPDHIVVPRRRCL